VAGYFQQLRAEGYNVSLAEDIRKRSAMRYQAGSVGLLFQPSLTYKLNGMLALQLGGYCMYQEYHGTTAIQSRHITDQVGSYNTHLNNAERSTQISYGVSAGMSLTW
jgi:hypothetical protein